MCFTVQLSRLSVLRQLCYFNMLSSVCQELFLISFFKLLQHLFFSTAFQVYHNSFALSRTFFLSFLKKERRRRDLNPRAAINDLLPFQGSPFGQLGYFSKLPQIRRFTETTFFTLSCLYLVLFVFTEEPCALYRTLYLFVKYFFQNFSSDLASGESGIRTHAPLRTNGFQDRLVMTTSISLHMLLTAFVVFSPPTQVIFQHQYPHLSTTFLHFFQFLFLSSQISHKTR